MFEAVSKVGLSTPKALQKTGLDLVNIGPFYGPKPSQNPLTSELPSYHLKSESKVTCQYVNDIIKF
jgi:hypothetical protein